jgi:predicted HTH domain antitoxin
MNAQTITIEIPQGITDMLSAAAVEREIRRYLAVKYYLDESITIGKAAELAGMNRMEFDLFLGQNQIPISLLDYQDIHADIKQMKLRSAR